jgi:hypothetical protein
MLKRLPKGIQTFSEIRKKGYLYVDKTALVYRMIHDCILEGNDGHSGRRHGGSTTAPSNGRWMSGR